MDRMKAILVFTAALAFAASPFMVQGFNGFSPDQFPVPQDDPPVQPAGYAFSIWGLIYLWLIVHGGFGLLQRAEDSGWDAPRWPLFVSLTVGTAWIPVAQISVLWATVLIWIMLITALAALLSVSRREALLLQAPIALYAGWLTAASCVAVGLVLAGYGFASPQVAAIAALLLALVIAATTLKLAGRAPAYAFGVIWALIGVAVANYSPMNPIVLGLAVVGALAIAGLALRQRRA
jgi:hypothetical protein